MLDIGQQAFVNGVNVNVEHFAKVLTRKLLAMQLFGL
jgi:hypothetical protein